MDGAQDPKKFNVQEALNSINVIINVPDNEQQFGGRSTAY